MQVGKYGEVTSQKEPNEMLLINELFSFCFLYYMNGTLTYYIKHAILSNHCFIVRYFSVNYEFGVAFSIKNFECLFLYTSGCYQGHK